jgi:formiminotetrahydrofolate cyclodeaminase
MLNVEVNLVSLRNEDYRQEVLKEAEEFSCPDSLAKMIVSKVEARLR